jgi:hypothetical protein
VAISSSLFPSAAAEAKFTCKIVDGIPTTVVSTPRGQIPTFRWRTSFTGRYANTQHRCQEVSNRLNRFDRQGKLKYIRTANINGFPAICVDRTTNSPNCAKGSILVTLKPGTDAGQVLQQMLDLRARAAGRSIDLGGQQTIFYRHGHAYLNLDLWLGND